MLVEDEADGTLSGDGADAGGIHCDDLSCERSEATEEAAGVPGTVVTPLIVGEITDKGCEDGDEVSNISLPASTLSLVDGPRPTFALGVGVEVVDTESGSVEFTVSCQT